MSLPNNDAAVAAIAFALTLDNSSTRWFLEWWNEGEFGKIRRNFENIPDEVFMGADPLFGIKPEPTPLEAALDNLVKAVEFRQQVKVSDEDTIMNGAQKDSLQWLDEAATGAANEYKNVLL